MLRVLFVLIFPVMIFAASGVSNIYRIGSASISVDGGDHSVDGTLLGYKRHISDGSTTFGADINYIFVDSNNYGIDDTAEAMLHLGTMASDAFEIYGSLGFAMEGSADGMGWGFGMVYAFNDSVSVTYEYRSFEMEDSPREYTLKSASLGILISF